MCNPGIFKIEKSLFEWTASLIGYPKDCGGNFTTGGSMGYLSAICSARDSRQIRARDYEKQVFYVTCETHTCYQKAINTAGMRESIIRFVDIDSEFRMNIDDLKKKISKDLEQNLVPFMVIGTAGQTNTGQIDPLYDIGQICQKYNIWYHVDGAYGGYFTILEDIKYKFKGIELSDSIVLDPHKTLNMPYGLGLVLVKDVQHMLQAFDIEKASYMRDVKFSNSINNYPDQKDISNELSKGFRSYKLWMSLKYYGLQPFRNNLKEKITLAEYFIQKLRDKFPENFEVAINKPDLSIVCFRYQNQNLFTDSNNSLDKFNQDLNNYICQDGDIFLSSTNLNNQVFLRICLLSFRTHQQHVDLCIEKLEQGIQNMLPKFQNQIINQDKNNSQKITINQDIESKKDI